MALELPEGEAASLLSFGWPPLVVTGVDDNDIVSDPRIDPFVPAVELGGRVLREVMEGPDPSEQSSYYRLRYGSRVAWIDGLSKVKEFLSKSGTRRVPERQ